MNQKTSHCNELSLKFGKFEQVEKKVNFAFSIEKETNEKFTKNQQSAYAISLRYIHSHINNIPTFYLIVYTYKIHHTHGHNAMCFKKTYLC